MKLRDLKSWFTTGARHTRRALVRLCAWLGELPGNLQPRAPEGPEQLKTPLQRLITRLKPYLTKGFRQVQTWVRALVARLKPRTAVGIDMGAERVRLVELAETKDGLKVGRTEVLDIPDEVGRQDPQQFVSWLVRELRERGYRDRRLGCEVPINRVIQRFMSLPTGTDEELAQMVRFQMERELPLPRSSSHLDYMALDTRREGLATVLLAAVQKEALRDRDMLLESGGFSRGVCVIGSEAALLSCRDVFVTEPGQVKCLLVFRNGTAEVIFGKGRDILFARSLSLLPADSTVASSQRPVEELVAELRRSISAFRAEWRNLEVSGLVLSGSVASVGADGSDLATKLEQALGMPVETYNPFLRKGLLFENQVKEKGGAEFCVALGIALATLETDWQGIDFWHPKTARRPAGMLTQKRKLTLAGAALAACVVLVSFLSFQLHKGKLRSLERELERLTPTVAQVDLHLEKLLAVKPWTNPGTTPLDVLREVTLVFPPTGSAYVIGLTLDESGRLHLTGRAKRSADVYQLVQRMNDSSYFRDAARQTVGRDDFDYSFPYEFAISSKIHDLQGVK